MKGANVLFSQDHDPTKGAVGKVYLVDYGLVSKYRNLGLHKAFEPDQRSAHEGTLEYTSRDAHLGCKFNLIFLNNYFVFFSQPKLIMGPPYYYILGNVFVFEYKML